MYEQFFNLKEKPFNLTPSSRFLYLGEAHREALALLKYGVMERKGFVLLTGEVGTGKTTMVQAFLGDLDKRAHCIHLSNPLLTPQDLYNYLAFSAFKKRVIYKSKAAFIMDFEGFLKERLKNEEVFILVIDEAQRLSYELLEEIRLLSNMETAEEKLINIFLIGQPELNRKLNDPKCRPLLQRISIRYHIKPLNLEETLEYLSTRLRVAGVEEMGKIFPKRVAEAIYDYSQGYPRVINVLADNVLLMSFSKNERKIKPESVRQCYEDMKLEGSFLSRGRGKEKRPENPKVVDIRSGRYKKLGYLMVFLVLGFLGFLGAPQISDRGRAVISQIETFLPENAQAWLTPQAKPKATEIGAKEELSLNLSVVGKEVQAVQLPQPKVGTERGDGRREKTTVEKTTPDKAAVEKAAAEKAAIEKAAVEKAAAEKAAAEKAAVEKAAAEKAAVGKTLVPTVDNNLEAHSRKDKGAGAAIKTVTAVSTDKVGLGQGDQSLDFIIVKAGDTLIGLALKHYGRADGTILELLQERNPEIKNINRIEIGQKIHFPFLHASREEGKTFTVHVASFKPFENAQFLFQRFMQEGYEAYLMPAYIPEKGRVHRITLGSFKTRNEGDAFAAEILKKGIVGYAETILLDAR